MKKAIAADTKVNEGRLDARLEIDDASLINVSDKVIRTGALDIQLLEQSVLDNRNPTFFGLRDVNQHLFFHDSWFHWLFR